MAYDNSKTRQVVVPSRACSANTITLPRSLTGWATRRTSAHTQIG